MSTNSEQMNGIYLTPEGKAELEAKIAELEKYTEDVIKIAQIASDETNKTYLEVEFKSKIIIYKEILSSATVLPVEESWERLEENLLEGLHEHTKLQNVIHIDYPQGVIIQPRLIQTTERKL